MKVGRFEKTLDNIAERIEYLINTYYRDCEPFRNVGLKRFFDFVANEVRYVNDPPGEELIMRPLYLLKIRKGDCDDKTVLFGAYLKMRGIPFGYSLVSQSIIKNYHHVFPFVLFHGRRLDVDATYAGAEIFREKPWARRKDKIMLGA